MKTFWDKRYAATTMAYGVEPNQYFKEQISKLKAGSILLPAEGEGRNAIFAAKLGWQVSAFDISIEGKKKADNLAVKNNVSLDYKVGGFSEINYKAAHFDCIALIYAHFPPQFKSEYHRILSNYLRKGGLVIFEGFSKNHLKNNIENPKSGGPKDSDMLFSIEEIKNDFNNYTILELEEKEVYLNEGEYHIGKSSVIRFVGRKK
jgi:SAM-dependent methyltransferase